MHKFKSFEELQEYLNKQNEQSEKKEEKKETKVTMEFLAKFIGILGSLLEKLDVFPAVLLLIIVVETLLFYFAVKVLCEAYSKSQDNRIEENKKMIQVQESTTTALNSLSKVVEVGFNMISAFAKK